MFELMVMLSRFIFVFLIAYFIVLGFLYIAQERDYLSYSRSTAIFYQRFAILAVHSLAFIVLSFVPSEYRFDLSIVSIGLAFVAVFAYSLLVVRVFFKDSCPLIWNGVFFLLDVGVIMLTRLSVDSARKQIVWIFLGITLTILIPLVFRFVKRLYRLQFLYLILAWAFVLLPFVFGKKLYGATNWVTIHGITFQPSEIVKFFYIFYLASVFTARKTLKEMIFPTLMAGGIVICLVLQRDLGGALIFFMTYMVIVYISSGRVLYFAAGFGFAALAAKLAYGKLGHVQRRVEAWANPWANIDDSGYQITQSLFAIGTWGLFGSGLTRGYPYKIPVVETDFIFSAVCEEFGMLFGLMLIGILIMIFFRGAITSLRSNNDFNCMLAASITGILAFQSFLILGGVIKLIPMTGVTLPFVSYGGSSIVVSIIMIGILAQLSKQIETDTEAEMDDEEEEYEAD